VTFTARTLDGLPIISFHEYSKEGVQELSQIARVLTLNCRTSEKKILSPAEVRMMLFRGTSFWVLMDRDAMPVSLNATHFGKRKKNVWEPYANWYTAFTRPESRRMGYAKGLGWHVRREAVEAGCVRLRSLAGTYLGYRLHRSFGDQFWGITDKDELVVDTPLVTDEVLAARGREPFPSRTTPMGARKWAQRTSPLTPTMVEAYLERELRYDKEG
jgi:hypothetical protein